MDKWIKTVGEKATTPEGKLYSAQLGSVISFYNKAPDAVELPEINWEDWSTKITTKGLVDKIRANTQSLLGQKYNLTAVAERLGAEKSEDYKRIVVFVDPVKRTEVPLHPLVSLLQGEHQASGPARRDRKPYHLQAARSRRPLRRSRGRGPSLR